MLFIVIAAALVAGGEESARADAGNPDLLVDGGLVLGAPAALPTGLSLGVGAGITRPGPLAWGVRMSWSTATEDTLDWSVRHDDLRLRATGALEHVAGRGTLMLRLGAGGNLVHETRTRDDGARAGLTGSDLETSAWAMLPAADLEAGVVLRLFGAWSVTIVGGPSVDLLDGSLNLGWIASLGIGWHD